MHIRSKVAAAVLMMAICGLPGFAQSPDEGPPPEQSQGPERSGPRRQMRDMRPGEPGGRGWMGMRGQRMGGGEFGLGRLLHDPAMLQRLGITPEQAAKIRQQELDFRKANIRNRADLEIKRMELNDLISADNPDRSAIDNKLQEVGAAQLAMEKSSIDFRLTMRSALTPAQREKLRQMRMERGRPGANVTTGGPQGMKRFRRPTPPPPPKQQPN